MTRAVNEPNAVNVEMYSVFTSYILYVHSVNHISEHS